MIGFPYVASQREDDAAAITQDELPDQSILSLVSELCAISGPNRFGRTGNVARVYNIKMPPLYLSVEVSVPV